MLNTKMSCSSSIMIHNAKRLRELLSFVNIGMLFLQSMAGASVPPRPISSCYPSFCVSDRILNSLFLNNEMFSAIIPIFGSKTKYMFNMLLCDIIILNCFNVLICLVYLQ